MVGFLLEFVGFAEFFIEKVWGSFTVNMDLRRPQPVENACFLL